MKIFLRIILVVIYFVILLWAFGNSIDAVPFHLSDFIVALFAIGGIIHWAEFDVDYILKFIEWLKNRKKTQNGIK